MIVLGRAGFLISCYVLKSAACSFISSAKSPHKISRRLLQSWQKPSGNVHNNRNKQRAESESVGKPHQEPKTKKAPVTKSFRIRPATDALTASAFGSGVEAGRHTISITTHEASSGQFTLRVTNESAEDIQSSSFCLYALAQIPELSELKFSDSLNLCSGTAGKYVTLSPGQSYDITVDYCFPQVGKYTSRLAFMFIPLASSNQANVAASYNRASESFSLLRLVEFSVENQLMKEVEATSHRFAIVDQPVLQKFPVHETAKIHVPRQIVRAPPLAASRLNELLYTNQLDHYDIPEPLRKIAQVGYKPLPGLDEQCRAFAFELLKLLNQPLTPNNYLQRMSMFLHMEELELEMELQKHQMKHAVLGQNSESQDLFTLKLPKNIPENLFAAIRGNRIHIVDADADSADAQIYEGIIHSANDNEVTVAFSNSFYKDAIFRRFNVKFVLDRLCNRMAHRAINTVSQSDLLSVLFPVHWEQGAEPLYAGPIVCYNKQVAENKEQLQAVTEILRGTCRPAPYILYGPPGTGKTVTLVEAILQILKHIRGASVLVCAPSNIAADRIADLLRKYLRPNALLRLNGLIRELDAIHTELKDVCNIHPEEEVTYIPNLSKIAQYNVVVCTPMVAGKLVSANMPCDHFSHIIIDEATQGTEPETLVPIGGLFDPTSRSKSLVVLAGDPRQLGPELNSKRVESFGYGTSWLERLIDTCPVYRRNQNGHYNPLYVTKLLRNYRSHEALLEVPNSIFYESELVSCADEATTSFLCSWPDLPKQEFPLIFHGVNSDQKRDETSPSFFNAAEVSIVVNYVNKLLATRIEKGKKQIVYPADIGIISPYRAQVNKINEHLGRLKMYDGITVGSVAEFQGSERPVMILSTVRSGYTDKATRMFSVLGFLRNPKRFNTAITRAKALLIVIGNPFVLQHDPFWKCLIQYCYDNGAYKGVAFTPEEEKTPEQKLAETKEKQAEELRLNMLKKSALEKLERSFGQ